MVAFWWQALVETVEGVRLRVVFKSGYAGACFAEVFREAFLRGFLSG
jgi:hypothetical protein